MAGRRPALRSDFDLLFCVAADVPAGRIAGVWEKGIGARLIDRAIVLYLKLVVLLPNHVVVLDSDSGVRIVAQMQHERVAEVEDEQKRDEDEISAEQKALHARIIVDGELHRESR
jgi:hypothetical protein